MSAVQFHNVTLELGGRTVISNVSVSIAAGEFVGMLGPNGAGKTTLMRAILGLVPAAQGTILVLGRPPARGNPVIGYVPQLRSNAGALRLSGWDFVAAVIDGHRPGLPLLSKNARAAVDRALDLVRARDLAARPLSETSGGERQRLLIAQALVGSPRMLLLDEPLTNLDPHHQQAIVNLVRSVQAELGITILFSSHELNPLLGVLDRVLYLGSRQAALGPVDEVITSPILSRLYGSKIEVIRARGHIFIVSGSHEIEHGPHRHPEAAPSFQRT
ncbi:MAG TPA: ABC transporter ATP-binding protein [Rhizomicrobium sp.]|nr:ABC transporter ATP-binding protein [Rhizomicrobium sp.]